MLKRRQLSLNQNLGARPTPFHGVLSSKKCWITIIVNSIHGLLVSFKPIVPTTTPAIMQTRPSTTLNDPNVDAPVKKSPTDLTTGNVFPYNTKLTTTLSVFILASSSSHL
ncbi:hypothetical protein E6H34_04120 [Candidatus Bathyarchaeota archaeon]|nr:MAG: hypothetical protein E6H34_04120 [Candidatus Bathyarchaeota archaeon]